MIAGVRRARLSLVAAALVAVVAAACSSGARHDSTTGASGTATSPGAPVLVALGDDATGRLDSGSPIRASWPQEFYRAALPRQAVFVNLATDIAQTAGARQFETPLLADLHPTTVVALLGLGDVELSVDPAAFGRDLAGVVADARRAGAQRILLATLPDDGYPQVAQYNAQIRRVVAAAGVTLVDLVPLTVSGNVRYRPPTLSVFVPDDKGERTIADAFTRSYRAAFPNG